MKDKIKEDQKPVETRRTIEFGDNAERIQGYANLNTNGNFTKALNKLVDKALRS